jgi:hypothetical protein
MAAQVLTVLGCIPAGPAGTAGTADTALTTNRKGEADQSVGVGSTDKLSRYGNSALIEHKISI